MAALWFKASLALCAISSAGAFTLAFLMARHIHVQEYNLSAIYFYLHFQYNGWFLFASFGLFFSFLKEYYDLQYSVLNKKLFSILGITSIPTYLMSIMGFQLRGSLLWIADIAGIVQCMVLYYLIRLVTGIYRDFKGSLGQTSSFLWLLSAISMVLKIVLQTLSLIPELNQYAMGFRPAVIGYLHLVFLGVISFFIIGYINEVFKSSNIKINATGVHIFVAGVLLQELILMLQSFEALGAGHVPNTNLLLLFAALIIGTGVALIAFGRKSFSHKH